MNDEWHSLEVRASRLCRHLDISAAALECLSLLGDRLPLERLILQRFEPALGAMRTLVIARPGSVETPDLLTPLPEAVRALIRRQTTSFAPDPVIINDPSNHPVARESLRLHGIGDSSLLRMTLATDSAGLLGAAVLVARGQGRFSSDQAAQFLRFKEPLAIVMSNSLRHRELQQARDRLTEENRLLTEQLRRLSKDKILATVHMPREVLQVIGAVALQARPVLLTGERGVGKSSVARALHDASSRSEGPLISFRCDETEQDRFEGALFGREEVSPRGASSAPGAVERARGGTLFLRDIDAMPLVAQSRLLRVLRYREVERVGGAERVPVDCRVIASTTASVEALSGSGRLLDELLLAMAPIHVPPLRERRGELPRLVSRLLERKARALELPRLPALTEGALAALAGHDWPGNVRELDSVIDRALLFSSRGREALRFDGLCPAESGASGAASGDDGAAFQPLDGVVALHIRRALALSRGKVHGPAGAAALLGINPSTLRHRMRKLSIPHGRQARSRPSSP